MNQMDMFASQPQAIQPEPLTEYERYWHKHMARVFIEQARHFARRQPGYSATLLEWAANRRRMVQAGAA